MKKVNYNTDTLDTLWSGYIITKENAMNKLKGGNKPMETKSRYEVISELEEKKRNLIREKNSFDDKAKEYYKEIKEMKRELEDKEEEVKEFIESIEDKKETITELIKSIDDSLSRFAELSQKK